MTDIDFDLPKPEGAASMAYSFDYARIPLPLRLGTRTDDIITLFKGAKRGFEKIGLLSYAVQSNNSAEIESIKRMIEAGNLDEIKQEFDKHTSAHPNSAFVSTTLNPQLAQTFAPSGYGQDTTIYRIEVAASRCVLDAWDTGNTGKSREILVLGIIKPSEIRAVKIVNDSMHSELLRINERGTTVIPDRPDLESFTDLVRDPNNWRNLH